METIPFLLFAGLLLCTFFLVSFTSQKFRLPSVLLYIILGVAVSSFFHDIKAIHTVAEIGIVLLFFILGLEFPLARMVSISKKIWPAGMLDVGFNMGGAMLIAMVFGMSFISAFIIGSVAYATSSSISAKMLEEKKRLANSEAEFILALLIFEDLVAPLLVSFIAGINAGESLSPAFMGILVAKILLLVIGAIVMGHYGFSRLNQFVSKYIQHDFMPLLGVGVALAYAGLAISLGLSEILGAFLAGVMLSETGRSPELEHLTLPVRDLTLPFFFFWFGTTIYLGEGVSYVPMMVAMAAWAIVGKILTAFAGSRMFGLSPKASVRAGFSMVQRGEFSAIIASMAPAQLRVFSGIYIIITAFVGVYLFGRAPAIARWYDKRRKEKQAAMPAPEDGPKT
ncbi:CPA2 family monovalent cation:H+ antiporter-2 [Desulfosalsimonas propionicica]|uniref:CPA2 family monovalent cation:H+ antiporter-2 n=1 Tax=Desulfosalsimonas propionicica TaxID=332175 RepID=A0A7W0C782_9BACT|nr:CPA2 family monovalent cation:H+ antiporter-2 [Desulfosalsimonas propionicica]